MCVLASHFSFFFFCPRFPPPTPALTGNSTPPPPLQDNASALLLLRRLLVVQHTSDGIVENLLEPPLRKGGALHILEGADLVGQGLAALEGHGLRARGEIRPRTSRLEITLKAETPERVPRLEVHPPYPSLHTPGTTKTPIPHLGCVLFLIFTRSHRTTLLTCCFFSPSFLIVSGSLRRSSLVPTRMKGTPGAWCWISGHHLDFTLSKLGVGWFAANGTEWLRRSDFAPREKGKKG